MEKKKKTLKLRIGNREEWVSADRVKAHVGEDPVAAEPPRRGRPPGTCGRVTPDPTGPGLGGAL